MRSVPAVTGELFFYDTVEASNGMKHCDMLRGTKAAAV
jgi:hypothetical protein